MSLCWLPWRTASGGPLAVRCTRNLRTSAKPRLGQGAARLQHLGLLETVRGRSGGVRLAATARTASIGGLVRELEGGTEVVDCDGDPIQPQRAGDRRAEARAGRCGRRVRRAPGRRRPGRPGLRPHRGAHRTATLPPGHPPGAVHGGRRTEAHDTASFILTPADGAPSPPATSRPCTPTAVWNATRYEPT
ncbi:Rrf2 family transcriptional regulator [Nonomuraea sp. NPDC049129]|uniref:Rrf2 family transcriptional regulator n=1 Tax=Nonomuraea sp. NPDC049129 TaxID=3155272 RepID=UPI0033D0C84C